MIKIHLFALLAATSVIALVSCNKEIETPDLGTDPACPEGYYVEELTAVYPRDPETRTAFNETTGRFAWTAGDELAFHLSNGEYVAAPIDPATGKVKLYLPVGVTRDNYAVYPASAVVDEAAAIGNMKVTLPDTYDISANPNTDFVPTPLVAWNDAENTHLKFEHVGGLLQVNLNVPAGVKTVTLSMGKTITGTFSLEDGTGNGIITPGSASDEGLTFILSEDGLAESTEVKLLAPLPTGSYDYFKVAYDDGFEFEKDLATPWNFTRSGGKKVSIAEDKFEAPDYFWLEALEAGSTVSYAGVSPEAYQDRRNLYYSFDKRNWTRVTSGNDVITLENEGDRVWFYSTGNTPLGSVYGNSNDYISMSGKRFKGTGQVKAGGELAYLWKKGEAEMVENNFVGLFAGMTSLIDASEIIFPEETAPYCYYGMFYNCTGLTTGPAVLPAMELTKACYNEMFQGCSSLVAGPNLPAKNAAESCYAYMFRDSGITVAPEIALEHMASNSCAYMFRGADNLVVGPVFHNVDLAKQCLSGAFMGCDALVTAPVLPSVTELAEDCYYYMFQSCTSMTEVPFDLPAVNVPNSAYQGMFWGCTSLEDNAMPTTPRVYDVVEASGMQGMYANCKSLKNVIVPDILQPVGGASLASMFAGCSNLESGEVLTTHFYQADGMRTSDGTLFDLFYDCTNLASIKVYFTEWSYMRTDQWVYKVKTTDGKFYCPEALPHSTSNPNCFDGNTYIPKGWTVYIETEATAGL